MRKKKYLKFFQIGWGILFQKFKEKKINAWEKKLNKKTLLYIFILCHCYNRLGYKTKQQKFRESLGFFNKKKTSCFMKNYL